MKNNISKILIIGLTISILATFFLGCASLVNRISWFDSEPNSKILAKFLSDTRQHPGNPDSHYLLACYYQERGRHREAIQEFKKVLMINPNYVKAYNGLGVSYDLIADFPKAVEAYNIALQLNPDLDYVYNNLGYSYLLQGNYDEAINAFKKAISLNGQEKKFHQNLGLAYAEKGEYELALAEFKMANNEANAHFYLAQICFEKGLYEHAKKHYAAALSLNPSLTVYRTTLKATEAFARIFGQENKRSQEPLITPASLNTVSEEAKILNVSDNKIKAERRVSSANLNNEQMISREKSPAEKILAEIDNKELAIVARWKSINISMASKLDILDRPANNKQNSLKRNLVLSHNGRVEISNGNGVNRMARKVGDYLKEKGFKVTHFTNANHFKHLKTKIIYERNYDEEAKKIAGYMPIDPVKEKADKFAYPGVKIKLVIGQDLIPYLRKFENNKRS